MNRFLRSQLVFPRRLSRVFVVFAMISVFAQMAAGQNAISNGSISGRVTDSSGGVVVGATVIAKSSSTGVSQTSKTNAAGIYNFSSLPVGTYDLSVSQSGFKLTDIQNLTVQVGQTTTQDLVLQIGAQSETVTVTAEAPLLRASESSVSTVVDQQLIEGLPLSGRRYTDFVLLTPNVNPDGDFGLVSVAGQQGGADSGYANGNGSNAFTVDGANATSNYFGEARGRTRVPYVFGEESVQEFQVADSPYSAEYGGAGTGFVNTVTKSGTATFHGEAFYYHRNSATAANDAVDKANKRPKPRNVLHQFGGNIGGPIVQQKAWFFVDYEEQRQSSPISVISSYGGLDVTAFNGSDGNPLPAGTALPPPNGLFPTPGSFSQPPAPNDPNFPAYLQQVSNVLNLLNVNQGQRPRLRNNYTLFPKVDWQPGTNDRVSFVYNYGRFDSPGGEFTFNPVNSEGVQSLPNNFVHDHHATIHWSHTFNGDLLNDARVSFVRDDQIVTPSGLIPKNTPQVLLFPNGFFTLGNPSFAVGTTKEMQWEVGEQVAYTRGAHTLKFGFDFNRTHISDFFPGTFLGSYGFFSLTNFALGHWGFYNQNAGNPVFPFTVPYYGFYAQDKFKVTHRLTLDLGIREDFQVYPQPQGNPAFPLTGQFPNRYQRVSPRLGFAYQPLNKTVVRGGFGIFHELFNGINYENSVTSNGLPSRQSSFSGSYNSKIAPNHQAPTFPNTVAVNNGTFAGSSNLSLVDPSFQPPYILEASLEIQREVLPNTTVALGTMWTHAVHLIASTAFDKNLIPPPSGTTTYIVCPPGTTTASTTACNGPSVTAPTLDGSTTPGVGFLQDGLINPNLGQINALISPGTNNYNSLYFQLQRRVSHGLTAQLSYTFSKAILSNGADFNNQFNFRDTHGPSLLDQRHRLSIAAVYSPDASHMSDHVARELLSNWTISTVMGFNSGRPYTAVLGGTCTSSTNNISNCDGNGDNINNSAFAQGTNNTAAGIAGASPSPTQGFNHFYGPWIDEVDLGIERRFHLTEKHSISLKVQVFNLLNHPNYFVQNGGGVNATQYTPVGQTCGDGASLNQQCFLIPNPNFGALQSVSELNAPRILQAAFTYRF
jgi:Carboxypeptidase regulatory-like domain/TonB dependent receptor